MKYMKGVRYKYVVTYRMDDDVFAYTMSGNDLASLVGFSDCTGAEVTEVWEVSSYGNLMPVSIHYPDHAPYNRLMVEDVCGNVKEYEWEGH